MAVVDTVDQTVSILLSNGDGTFQAAVNYPCGSTPSFVVVGDFNGDGKLDLAVSNGAAQTVSILLGNGDGTFQFPIAYSTGINADYLTAADFNNDGTLDVLVSTSGSISVLLGNGKGAFQPPIVTSTGGAMPFIGVGDFNGDGKLDIATGNGTLGFCSGTYPHITCLPTKGNLIILLGNGDGTFQAPAVAAHLGIIPDLLVAADLNGDGKLDLAIEGFAKSCGFSIFRGFFCSFKTSVLTEQGNGDGTFNAPNNVSTITSSNSFRQGATTAPIMGVADLNNDGQPDIVVLDQAISAGLCSSCIPNLQTFLGNGDGTFQAPQIFDLSIVPNWAAVSDLNGDTLPDVILVNASADTASIFLNTTPSASLSVAFSGSGTGTVASQPAVLNCSSPCSGKFAPGKIGRASCRERV